MDIIQAAEWNNKALQLETENDFKGAEKLHLKALEVKTNSKCKTKSIVAITENGLGELYLKMGKLDDAEKMLKRAYNNRRSSDTFDRSCTADNLGRLHEMKGNLTTAREWRKASGQNRMVCSNFECPKSHLCVFSKLNELKKCSRCKCVFYCGKECQQQDWKRHKSFCRAVDDADVGEAAAEEADE